MERLINHLILSLGAHALLALNDRSQQLTVTFFSLITSPLLLTEVTERAQGQVANDVATTDE